MMKKVYEKPEIAFVQLRPEERLAVCSWPTGFTSTASYTCTQTWADVSGWQTTCTAAYNNSTTSGS